jgi:hypothetical protein
MTTKLQETSGNMPVDGHFINKLGVNQGTWTIESLGLEIEHDKVFTKEKFEEALKKVSHKIKE